LQCSSLTTGNSHAQASRVTIHCPNRTFCFAFTAASFSNTSDKQDTAACAYLHLDLIAALLLVALVPEVNAGKKVDNRAAD